VGDERGVVDFDIFCLESTVAECDGELRKEGGREGGVCIWWKDRGGREGGKRGMNDRMLILLRIYANERVCVIVRKREEEMFMCLPTERKCVFLSEREEEEST